MLYLYNFFIRLYAFAIRVASVRNKKARDWAEGRKTVFEALQKNLPPGGQVVWVHCSSAGEFEQGKPVIEAITSAYPACHILVTFFSPSGYRVARQYPHAAVITYLPLDTKDNAARFFHLVKPQLIIFIKYEFWYHHLATAAFYHVPVLLVSAVFRQHQIFFQRHGRFFRQMLHLFRHIFVQDQASLQLLQSAGIHHGSISGDTRFDRVVKITGDAAAVPFIDQFVANKPVMVAGSTWPGDEALLAAYIKERKEVKLILVPHEVNKTHVQQVHTLFPGAVLYSSLSETNDTKAALAAARVLIVDAVGFLSRLYRYATITYVGGGFTRDGIHNILEAAVWARPVLFGPNYKKYREAKEMIESGGAFSFETAAALNKLADDLLASENHLQEAGTKAKNYIVSNTGATGAVMAFIQEKRLLIR